MRRASSDGLPDLVRLVRAVPHLAPDTLHQLIRYRGLETSGEILAAATAAQITRLADLELWRPLHPAGDDRFDPTRFAEWIATLVETGDAVAARVVAGMDERVVAAGLSRLVRVFDPGALARPVTDDDDDEQSAGFDPLTADIGGYLVRGRMADSWDAIVRLLVSLEAEAPERFQSIMRGCRRLSDSLPEADGLDELLTVPAQWLHDIALEREARSSSEGYVTPADARAFLHAARRCLSHPDAPDPIAAAYLSPSEPGSVPVVPTGTPGGQGDGAPLSSDARETIASLADCLADAGLVPGQPRALLTAGTDPACQPSRLAVLMEHVRQADEQAYRARGRELAFLANCLLAGCSVQARSFTPSEASDAAAATCELGVEHWPAPGSRGVPVRAGARTTPASFLLEHDLTQAFRVGWAVLHQASLTAAGRLVAAVADLHVDDAPMERALRSLARELAGHGARGTPWLARDALDIIATLDVATWTAMLGLLDECPIVAAALPAVVEGRKGAVSATDFEFVSAAGQLAQIAAFLEKLPDLLIR